MMWWAPLTALPLAYALLCWLIKTGTAIYRRRDTSLRSAALPFRRRLRLSAYRRPVFDVAVLRSLSLSLSLRLYPDRLF